MDELRREYTQRFPLLEKIATRIESDLKCILEDEPRIDSITARAKSVESFINKAQRIYEDDRPKYEFPLQDIQDQVGVRVVVYYRSDVPRVTDLILQNYNTVENQTHEEPDPWRFGYQAQHCVCLIPPDLFRDINPEINFFEIQISTLFQHAWAEANHDLAYKVYTKLDDEISRKIAWAAAQAWGADVIFDEIKTAHTNEQQ
jgi:ppGpp synthetase/RelA/SpoT-type nucleotidyltranferase